MNQSLKNNRIDVVDALRGFAVAAILLLHFVEHFIYNIYPESATETSKLINQGVWDSMFFLLGGKSYAIFALLFGFTFIIQQRNQENKGGDFGGRFAWRLILLSLFATINAAFFPGGDVLLLFTITGFIMIPFRKLSEKWLLTGAIFFLIQPIEWLSSFGINIIPSLPVGEYYQIVTDATASGNFGQMVWANITTGQIASLFWAIDAGRFCQTIGLLLMGMLIARGNYFTKGIEFWTKVFIIGILGGFIFYIAKGSATGVVKNIFTMWFNLSFTSIIISIFVILYNDESFRNICSGLRIYGKMSLTNYISQSIIGSIIFFPYALGLAPHLNIAFSLAVGVIVMLLQIKFCQYWLKSNKQGPLENIWKQMTWIFSKKKSSTVIA